MGTILNLRLTHNTISIIALYAMFFIFIISTSPIDLHAGWLLFPLAILYAALYKSFRSLFAWRSDAGSSRQRVMAGLVAAIPIILMGLGSAGQLTGRDVVIIVAFGLVGMLYVSRLDL